ncbi:MULTISPECIES: DUF1294 domain-containing protein [Streptococcus]|uniref:DUF1294 domain-containing protein n=1 Tax=Streptococcus caledonicus TaxID=2614158 RepID=A0ABW0UGA3_9STRE|nr:DUF1294 domain-containing protein [Streptococcus sp. S784/96/1]
MKLAIVILLIWNLIVFMTYGIDKHKSVANKWRISEKSLLLMTLCAGGLGALLGGEMFHHKTRKWYFQLAWYLGILIQAVICYGLWYVKQG